MDKTPKKPNHVRDGMSEEIIAGQRPASQIVSIETQTAELVESQTAGLAESQAAQPTESQLISPGAEASNAAMFTPLLHHERGGFLPADEPDHSPAEHDKQAQTGRVAAANSHNVAIHSKLLVSNISRPEVSPVDDEPKETKRRKLHILLFFVVASILFAVCAAKDYRREAFKVGGDWAASNGNTKLSIQLFSIAFGEPPGKASDGSTKLWTQRYWSTVAHIGVLKDLAAKCTKAGDYQAAVKYWTEMIRLRPDCSAYYSNRGINSWLLNRLPEANADFTQALKMSPRDPAILNNVASIYMENGNLESAQDYLKRAIKLDPKRSLYYSNLGDCYYRKENWDAALDYYIKATDLGNRKAWAKRLLARMARHDGYDYQLIDRIMCEKLNVRTKDIERFAFDWDARETPE